MNTVLSMVYDGEVFRPETPLDLAPYTRYEVTLRPIIEDVAEANTETLAVAKGWVGELYILTDPSRIKEYLENNPAFVEFLKQAHSQLKTCFPTATYLLRLAFPHLDTSQQQLVLAVLTEQNRAEVAPLFDGFKNAWWLQAHPATPNGNPIALILEAQLAPFGSLYDLLEELAGTYEGPEEWSVEPDRYLYGTTKREVKP